MAGVEEPGPDDEGTGKWKAFGVALGINLLCLPLVLVIIFFWPIFILAIAPYIAGAIGGRYTDRHNGLWMGGLAAVVMVTVLATILLSILAGLAGLGEGFDFFEPIGLGILAASYVTAFMFGALGGRHGAISREEKE
ncbi:MAG: hypothetical protein JSW25_07965 [Thermoplasmata archaeon]|nr:MAG: hypothetical protein JSW25_07965 [Thermoplasmata archaeon]